MLAEMPEPFFLSLSTLAASEQLAAGSDPFIVIDRRIGGTSLSSARITCHSAYLTVVHEYKT